MIKASPKPDSNCVLACLVDSGVAITFFQTGHQLAGRPSFGAWLRIQEFARLQGKTNYIAEADKTVAMIERDLKQWRDIAMASGTDLSPFDKLQATAYKTTDQNIQNGKNPLAHLDVP